MSYEDRITELPDSSGAWPVVLREDAAKIAAQADERIDELELSLATVNCDLLNTRRELAVMTGDNSNLRAKLESARAGESAAMERIAELEAQAFYEEQQAEEFYTEQRQAEERRQLEAELYQRGEWRNG